MTASGLPQAIEGLPQLTLLRAILDACPGPIHAKRADGTIVFANGAMAALYHLTAEQLVGHNVRDLHANTAEVHRYQAIDDQVLTTGEESTSELTFTPPGQATRYFQSIRRRILSDSGEPLLLAISTDVTATRLAELASTELKNKLEQANGFLDTIQRNLPVGVFVKSADPQSFGRFVLWNPKCGELFGHAPDEVVGLSTREVYGDQVGLAMEESDRRAVDSRQAVDLAPLNFVSVGGVDRWIHTIKVPVFDDAGRPRWVVGITEDVTVRLRTEQEREGALRRAEEASRVKSQFLANMSHEIRTPMNGVMGLISLALDADLPADTRELLRSAQGSANTLLAIIGDILDLSKIEAGKLALEDIPFSLRDVVRDTAVVLTPKADERGLSLLVDVAPDVPDLVRGDPVRVRQVLTNLLGNALKFTEQGHVRLDVWRDTPARHDTEPRLVFSVSDTGIGIAPDKLETIFQPFSQADTSTTRRFGGTGLGLTICRELARRMRGDLVASSQPGQGSRFDATLRLPRSGRDEPAPFDQLAVAVFGSDPKSRAIVARALEGLGAVDTRATPQVAVLDLTASLDEGPFTRFVEALPPGVPVVCLTSTRAPALPETLGARPVSTLRKPVTSNDLRLALTRALTEQHADTSAPTRVDQSLTGLRVLLAEDNPINTLVATTMLSRLGCVVTHAVNGQVALERLDAQRFDAVLLDMQMPVMDGLECARTIRELEGPTGRHTPLIALTANAMTGDDTLCLAAGMDRYLSKPIDRAKLLEVLLEVRRAA